MKLLVVLCAVAACAVAKPFAGYSYSALAPLSTPFANYGYYGVLPYSAVPAPAVLPAPAPAVVPAPVPALVGIKSQYYAQDYSGLVSYGHAEPLQTQSVIQDAAGNKVGSFSYVNPEGKIVQTNYVADANGYRVASNDLPVAPEAPVVEPAVLPEPVQDTPEVAEAKAKFLNEYEQAKNRERRSVPAQTPASTSQLAAPVVPAPLVAPAPIISPYSSVVAPAPIISPYSSVVAPAPLVSAYSGPVVAPAPYAYPYGYPSFSSFIYSK